MILSLIIASATAIPYAEKKVDFPGADGLILHGTLVRPAGTKLPAVVLLPGSGPTDRDGNQGALVTDLLKQIADRLAKEGIASLRFDKRATSVYSANWPLKDMKKMNDFFGWDKFTGDAKGALKYLQAQPNIDGKRTGIIGHSEGSGLAIQIGHDFGKKPGGPKALVLLGAPGRTLEPIILEQVAASLGRANSTSATVKKYVAYTELAIKTIKTKGEVPPNPPPGLEALFNKTAVKLMQSYFKIDPSVNIKAFPGPVLVVQGEKDIQVSAVRDTPLLMKALKARGGVSDVMIAKSASHNLKAVGDENTEFGFAGEVVPEALDKIVKFLKKHL
jgi:uncharacterized protein